MSDADAAALGMDAQPPEFYDPEADERDEAWVHKARGALRSDAILSCPLCFTTLCIDCQQHAKYDGQFRAMFVMNCRWVRSCTAAAARARRSGRRQELLPVA